MGSNIYCQNHIERKFLSLTLKEQKQSFLDGDDSKYLILGLLLGTSLRNCHLVESNPLNRPANVWLAYLMTQDITWHRLNSFVTLHFTVATIILSFPSFLGSEEITCQSVAGQSLCVSKTFSGDFSRSRLFS